MGIVMFGISRERWKPLAEDAGLAGKWSCSRLVITGELLFAGDPGLLVVELVEKLPGGP